MIDNIRLKIMTRIDKGYAQGCKWESEGMKVTPFARKRLAKAIKDSRFCKLLPASKQEFQVVENGTQYAVDYAKRYCSCGEWSISGLPCRHVVCCLPRTRGKIEDLCDDYFSIKTYLKTYDTIIHPLPEVSLDADDENEKLQPPPLKRLPGRPKTNRKREQGEPTARKRSSTVRCGNCKGEGHNRRGCQLAPVNSKSSQKKRMSGKGGSVGAGTSVSRGGGGMSGSVDAGCSVGRGRGEGGRGGFQFVAGTSIGRSEGGYVGVHGGSVGRGGIGSSTGAFGAGGGRGRGGRAKIGRGRGGRNGAASSGHGQTGSIMGTASSQATTGRSGVTSQGYNMG